MQFFNPTLNMGLNFCCDPIFYDFQGATCVDGKWSPDTLPVCEPGTIHNKQNNT